MYGLVDEHRNTYGVEPICAVLQIAPSAYRRHAARCRDQTLLSARAQRDVNLMPKIEQVWTVVAGLNLSSFSRSERACSS